MRRYFCASLFMIAACGPALPEIDHTTVEGSALGASFSAPNAIYDQDSHGGVLVLVGDEPALCDDVESLGLLGRPVVVEAGRVAPSIFMLATNGTGSASLGRGLTADLEPGGHEADPFNDCGDSDGGVVRCSDPVPAEEGAVDVFAADDVGESGAQATGTFDLRLGDGGHLSGRFRATPCPKLHESLVDFGCSSASGATLIPLLALFGLRRRRFTSRT